MLREAHAFLHRASRALAAARSARALRSVDSLGARVVIVGAPYIENLGAITIGDDAAIVSEPVQSHLVTGKGARLVVGSGVTIGAGAAITAHASVTIEDGARLGRGVVIMDTDFHDTKDHAAGSSASPVVIGRGASIGDRVTILKGSKIGAGARVEAGSVVSGDIAEGALARGVPAREVVNEAEASGDVGERVAAIVARTFRVASASPDDGPATVRGWDSLGSLRLLVAVEDAFHVVLPEKAIARATTVRALAAEVAAQIARGREVAP